MKKAGNSLNPLLACAALLMIGGKMLAAGPEPLGDGNKAKDLFRAPAFIFPIHTSSREEQVEVLFTVDEESIVDYVVARTEKEEMRKSIERRFMGTRIRGLRPRVMHSVILNLRKD